MLPMRKLWHNAFKRAPERDARLLCRFAQIINNAGATPDSAETPEEKDLDAESTLETETEKTKDQVKNLIAPVPEKAKRDPQVQENMNKMFENIIKKASENGLRIRELKERMSDPDVIEKLRRYGNPTLLSRWMNDIQLLHREEFHTTEEKDFAQNLERFWSGDVSPESFLNRQREYMSSLPYGFQQMGKALGQMITIKEDKISDELSNSEIQSLGVPYSAATEKTWITMNHGSKIEAIDGYFRNIQIDDWMKNQISKYDDLNTALDQQEQFVSSIEKQKQVIDEDIKIEAEASKEGIMGQFSKIRWRSINDYMRGIGKYWNALKSTWETRGDRISAGIARNIGKTMKPFNFFPFYGEEVETILGQQLDSKDNEEEEGMSKSLENNHAIWGTVFGPTGVFKYWARKNPNKARGCLSWAANHGFLYDVDDNLDNHDHPIYGIPIADICSDWAGDQKKISNYFTVLRNKNSSGREHEKEHGLKTEKDIGDVSRFISLIEHEMHEQNLWAAAGICERAMQRGLNGEVSAYLYTTIMSLLRHDPALRKVTPVAFFDIVGKLGAFTTAFTLGWMHMKRRDLKKWALSGDEFGPPDESILDKTPLKYVGIIEKEIIAKNPSLNIATPDGGRELNELTAKVLSGSIVELPGGSIHIFESRFKPYRDEAKRYFAAAHDPHKEDPDFARNYTEKILLPEGVFKTILDLQSTNLFKSEAWVQPFLGSFISLETKLREKSGKPGLKDAHQNFCDETRYKFDSVFQAYEGGERVFVQLNTKDTLTNKPAIASLIAGNLLSFTLIENTNEKTAALLKQQLSKYFPEYNWQSQEKHPEWRQKAEKNSEGSDSYSSQPAKTTSAI
jgi:hypothetical protein